MIDIGIIKIRKSSVISFSLGFSGVVLMFILRTLNFHPGEIVRPYFESTLTKNSTKQVESSVLPKLQKIQNKYHLKQNSSFIPKAQASSDYDLASAYGAVNFDSGEIILGKNTSSSLPIASLTKIMSAVVALDLADPDDTFDVKSDAAKITPTRIGVVPGQKMKLSELLTAALMTSANDAIQVIKDGIDARYGEGTFVYAMNAKANILGLKNTHFENPQGFDSKQNYSTVEDLAILSHYAISNYPLIPKIARQDYTFLPEDQNHKRFDLYNWNGLIDVYPDTVGLKIGNTGDAGYTTIVLSKRAGENIMSIVLGAPGILERDLWASELLDLSYVKTKNLSPIAVTPQMLKEKYSTWQYWD